MSPSPDARRLVRLHSPTASDDEIRERTEQAGVFVRTRFLHLNQSQYDALVSLYDDILQGVGSFEPEFQQSRLFHAVNAQKYQLAGAEFTKWVYRGGRIDTASVHYRAAEQGLFYKPVAHVCQTS